MTDKEMKIIKDKNGEIAGRIGKRGRDVVNIVCYSMD